MFGGAYARRARWAVLAFSGVVALGGCGRLGFSLGSQDGGAPNFLDAGAPPPDGAPADAGLGRPDARGFDAGTPDGGSMAVDAALIRLPTSCSEVLAQDPGAGSGTYRIEPTPGMPIDVFCEMDRAGGGWTQAVDFDAARDPCPGDWVRVDGDPVVCAREMSQAGSRVALFQPPVPYTEVLGFALGYQQATTDGFRNTTIDDDYVDGVSITYRSASGAREHLWSYASGWSSADRTEPWNMCPCLGGRAPPAFVGENYWCESGTTGNPLPPPSNACSQWYFADPLWDGDHDGMGCGVASPTPWFERQLPASTTSPIEVRLMMNQTSCEDVGVAQLQLYVR